MKLTNEQIDILRDGKIQDNKFYLQGQLNPKEYKKINEVLETIGLKRNRKEKAHIADCTNQELLDAIDDIIETGEVETLKETIKKFQFYETPREVADYIIELADIDSNDFVLEPSCGLGAIAKHLRAKQNLVCIEIDEGKIAELSDNLYFGTNTTILNQNFLDYTTKVLFDKVIANPPFSKSQDVKHILKMYELIKDGGRIVSVASSSVKYRTGKLYDEFNSLNPQFYELPEGSFKESGTMVNTVIVVIDKK